MDIKVTVKQGFSLLKLWIEPNENPTGLCKHIYKGVSKGSKKLCNVIRHPQKNVLNRVAHKIQRVLGIKPKGPPSDQIDNRYCYETFILNCYEDAHSETLTDQELYEKINQDLAEKLECGDMNALLDPCGCFSNIDTYYVLLFHPEIRFCDKILEAINNANENGRKELLFSVCKGVLSIREALGLLGDNLESQQIQKYFIYHLQLKNDFFYKIKVQNYESLDAFMAYYSNHLAPRAT